MYLVSTLHPMLHCMCMYVDVMHLRLPDLNKETTYLLTYILTYGVQQVARCDFLLSHNLIKRCSAIAERPPCRVRH